jgi:hypothetical protein
MHLSSDAKGRGNTPFPLQPIPKNNRNPKTKLGRLHSYFCTSNRSVDRRVVAVIAASASEIGRTA